MVNLLPLLDDPDSLSPCNHKEADSCMLLHANHSALCVHLKTLIRTVDTNVKVFVLAVSFTATLDPRYELWLAFGSGKHFWHWAAHKIAIVLAKKAQELPMFHALTGCDTVSSFVGHGKKTTWNTWNALPQLTDALLTLSCAPSDLQVDVLHTIERFVILLYDSTSTCRDIQRPTKTFCKEDQRETKFHLPGLLWNKM